MGATAKLMGSLNRLQTVFGVISAKMRSVIVTPTVANRIPYSGGSLRDSTIETLATVASAEAPTFTMLLPSSIVINRASLSALIFSKDVAHHRFSRTIVCTECFESVMSAISVPEKNADSAIKTKNKSIDRGSTEKK